MNNPTCSEQGCEGMHHARGWCARHYKRWRKWGDPNIQSDPQISPSRCSLPSCQEPHYARGWCLSHYYRQHRRGHEKRKRQEIRALVLEAYGGRCSCCGETNLSFLNLDHIERQEGKREHSRAAYQRAIQEGFPPTLRILCYNCNFGRENTKDRSCPHVMKGTTTVL